MTQAGRPIHGYSRFMTSRKPLVIDTDGGIDDAVALWWALDHAGFELIGITTVHGNVDVDQATANVCRILDAHGSPQLPVYVGAERAMADTPELRPADFIHGRDGLGDVGWPSASFGAAAETADAFLKRIASERTEAITIVTLGPLTNLATVIRDDPTWAATVGDLVVMGGAVATHGNAQPAAEANIAHDPTAAAIVVGARWARPPLLVGLDVTHRATFSATEFDAIHAQRTRAGQFLSGPLTTYRRFGGTFCTPGECPCHDLVAVMAASDDSLFDTELLPLAVVTAPGPAWGATIADRRVPFFALSGADSTQLAPPGFTQWRIALDVDIERFRAVANTMFA
jgi:purine nucleosidase